MQRSGQSKGRTAPSRPGSATKGLKSAPPAPSRPTKAPASHGRPATAERKGKAAPPVPATSRETPKATTPAKVRPSAVPTKKPAPNAAAPPAPTAPTAPTAPASTAAAPVARGESVRVRGSPSPIAPAAAVQPHQPHQPEQQDTGVGKPAAVAPASEAPAPVVPTLRMSDLQRGSNNHRSSNSQSSLITPSRLRADDLRTDNFLVEAGVLGSEVDRKGPATPRSGPRDSPRISSGPQGVSREATPTSSTFKDRGVSRSPRASLSTAGSATPPAEQRRRTCSPSATAAALRRISLSQSNEPGGAQPRLAATMPRMSQACSSVEEDSAGDEQPSLSGKREASRDSGERPSAGAAAMSAHLPEVARMNQDLFVVASSETYISAVTKSMSALYVSCYSPQDIGRLPFMATAPPTHVCLHSMPITTSVVANILSYCNRYEIHDLMFDNCVFTLYDYTWFRRVTGLKTIRLKGTAVGTRIVTQILKHATQVQNITLFNCNQIATLSVLTAKTCRIRSVQLINTDFSKEALADLANAPTLREVMLLNVGLYSNVFELFHSAHIESIHLVGCPDLYYAEKAEKEWMPKRSPRDDRGTTTTTTTSLSVRSLLVTDCESLALESLPWGEMTALEELSIMHREQQTLPIACLRDVFRTCPLRLLRLQHVFVDEHLVRQIQLCSELEELNLSFCKGFHGMGEIWRALSCLRRLNLSHSEVDSSHLNGLFRCTELEQVFVQHCPYVQDFGVFRGLPALQLLDLSGCTNLGDEGFLGTYDCRNLRCLILDGCTRLRDIAGLASVSGLEVLRLGGCHVREDGLIEVLRASAATLGELDLGGCDRVYDLSPVSFRACQALTHVNLSRSYVTDSTVAALAACPGLLSVDLSRCESVTTVGPLGGGSQLRHMDLSYSAITDKGLSDYADQPGSKYLEHLRLRGCTGVANVSCLGKLKRVISLDLSASSADATASLPAIAAGCECLEEIDLQECPRVTDISALGRSRSVRRVNASLTGITDACLSGLAQCVSIEELELSGCENLRNVSPLSGLQLLQRLNLSNTSVDVSSMAGFSQCSLLWDISLSNGRGVRDISVLSTIASLQRLDVSGTSVEDGSFAVPWRTPLLEELDLSGCRSLTRIEANTFKGLGCLRRVDLSGTGISDDVLERFVGCTALEELVLTDCPNIRNVAVLGGVKSLCVLLAAGTQVSDASFTEFSKCERLTVLDLSRCPSVGDLSALGRCRSLRVLGLSRSGVSDETFAVVGGRRSPWAESILHSLDLSDCSGIRTVPAIGSLRHLVELDVSGSAITDEGVAHIAGAPILRKLRMARCRGVSVPSALGRMTALKLLDMGGSSATRLVDEETGEGSLWNTPSLLRASFRGCDLLTDVSALRKLPSLSVLDVSESTCVDGSFVAGVPWSACTSLQVLRLHGCKGIHDLGGLRAMAHLTSLDLANSTASSDSIDGLRDCPSLEYVDLSRSSGLKNIEALGELPRLRHLKLAGSAVTSASFSKPWTCRSLLEIDFHDCAMVEGLPGLATLPQVRRIDLSHTSVSDPGLRAVSKIKSLEELSVSGCGGVRSVTALGHLHSLRKLDLSASRVDNTSLIALPMCPSLEELDLRACENITDAFLAHDFTRLRVLHMPPLDRIIGSFISHCPCLERLSLQRCPSTPHATTWFENLPFLVALDLSGSVVGADFLSCLLSCTQLEELDLSECPQVESVRALSGLLHFKRLNLSKTAITNAACQDIVACRGLQELSLSHCPGITDVSPLTALRRLRRLDLSGTAVTDSVFSVARVMPELEELKLRECSGITDASGLAGAPRIRRLDLSNSAVQTVKERVLRGKCPLLREISVAGCPNLRGQGGGMMEAAKSLFSGFFASRKDNNAVTNGSNNTKL